MRKLHSQFAGSLSATFSFTQDTNFRSDVCYLVYRITGGKGKTVSLFGKPSISFAWLTNIAKNAIATYTKKFFSFEPEWIFFQPYHAASEGLWSLPTRCLSRSFPENVLNKHTFGTMALKGEEISSAKNQTLLVKVQQPLRKTPESRAPQNPTSPHVWPIQNVCLPQHISTFFYPFRWSQLIDHERALSTDSREGRPFVQTTRTGSKANKRSAKQVPFAPN